MRAARDTTSNVIKVDDVACRAQIGGEFVS